LLVEVVEEKHRTMKVLVAVVLVDLGLTIVLL
jgi:hypothetical protein